MVRVMVHRPRVTMTNPVHNFLYVAFNFPPFAGASPRHNLSTVKGLLAEGFLPTVITASEQKPPPLLLDIRLAKDEYLRSKIPKEITVIPCDWPSKYHRLRPFILDTLRLTPVPYSFNRMSKHIANITRRQIESEDYKLIYSVNGIGLEHQAALKLKQSKGLPWVAEFRDPWIYNHLEWSEIKDRSWRWWYQHQFNVVRKILREVVKNADLIVVESPMHGALLTRDFKLDSRKVVALGMGYEADILHDITESFIAFPKRPVIGFVGRVYYGYQNAIKNFVEALKMLEREGYQFTLVSVGHQNNAFSKFANEVNLTNFVPIGSVNYLHALSIMNELDYGIVTTCKECFPHINSKLWEYLALNLSVLAIVPDTGSMAQIVKAGDFGSVLSYDKTQMFLELRTVLDDYKAGRVRRASPDFVMGYSRATMITRLAERMEELL
jgi:glycosyltransferase involved in cell wall biosynthesis